MAKSLDKLFYDMEDYFFKAISLEYCDFGNEAIAYCTGVLEPSLNILFIRNAPIFDQIPSQASAFFDSHKVPWCLILREDVCTENLLADLARQGFAFSETSVTMVLPLLKGAHLEPSDPNILIMDNKLDQWMLPMIEAFGSTFDNTKQYKNTHAQALARKMNLRHFSLFSDNKPISTLTLSWDQHCARIDDVSTLKAYQRQGNATALLRHALHVASAMGLRYCFLEASDSGASVYQKLGFKSLFRNRIMTNIQDLSRAKGRPS